MTVRDLFECMLYKNYKLLKIRCLILLFGGVFFMPPVTAADAERLVDSRWYQADSPNFRIISNGDSMEVEKLARELEGFRVAALGLLQLSGDSQKLTIIAAADRASYGAMVGNKMSLNTSGVYNNTPVGSYALLNLDGRGVYAIHPAREFLFHEYTHFLTYSRGTQRYPYWYSEGFAELLSTLSFTDDDRFQIGTPPASRAATLLNMRPMPLEQLLRLTAKEARKRDRVRLYASGWMLAHWLLLSSGKADEFGEYLRMYQQGADPVKALESALSMPIADIEAVYRQQFHGKFPVRSSAMPQDYEAPAIKVDLLSKPQAIKEIAQYLANVPRRTEQLSSILQEVSEKGGEIAQLKASLAEAKIGAGELDSAEQLLATIPQAQRESIWFRSPWAWLQLYRQLHRKTQQRDKAVLRDIRDQFVYLVNNNDTGATHWYGLALAMKMLGYPREKYTEMLEQAYFRAPRETAIAFELAVELYRLNDADYFAEVATPLLMDLDGRPEAERLQRMLAELEVSDKEG